ncbi:hypothetical protein ACD591_08825 [Rufibacter glacialis]|uniref:MarR family transcriptional regulator n=1 Tax=Rufibacter glacialis TaxID=1259555 RepID=A0ABV4RE59_9BACT|nr:hypothetical protein [Rufibacter glacialis]
MSQVQDVSFGLMFFLKRHQEMMDQEVHLSHQQIAHEPNSSQKVIS